MSSVTRLRFALATVAMLFCAPVFAIQTCELNGQPINPSNGADTAGKTGLMRCKEADTGVVVREQELQNGKTIGISRYFNKAGQLEREFSVNERGNREGLSRQWDSAEPGGKRVLVREETQRNGKTVGLVRSWYPNGERRRLTFYGEEDRELASVEFTTGDKVYDLRCTTQPVFGRDFDDKTACGHAGVVSSVTLYNGKGEATGRLAFERGERRRTESLWDNGRVHELREVLPSGVVERVFAEDGTKLREQQWTTLPATDGAPGNARPRNVKVLDQEFHASGKLVHETRWRANDRMGAELVSESRWYLNGQPRERTEFIETAASRTRRETAYHDNGKLASEGSWLLDTGNARSDRAGRATGVHKRFDEEGRVRSERVYDDRGRISREREFDERGTLTRDDEVFEDGSRKSMGR
jgi:antitoxin component YwqK of YwqJK toxin-antitoxin module